MKRFTPALLLMMVLSSCGKNALSPEDIIGRSPEFLPVLVSESLVGSARSIVVGPPPPSDEDPFGLKPQVATLAPVIVGFKRNDASLKFGDSFTSDFFGKNVITTIEKQDDVIRFIGTFTDDPLSYYEIKIYPDKTFDFYQQILMEIEYPEDDMNSKLALISSINNGTVTASGFSGTSVSTGIRFNQESPDSWQKFYYSSKVQAGEQAYALQFMEMSIEFEEVPAEITFSSGFDYNNISLLSLVKSIEPYPENYASFENGDLLWLIYSYKNSWSAIDEALADEDTGLISIPSKDGEKIDLTMTNAIAYIWENYF